MELQKKHDDTDWLMRNKIMVDFFVQVPDFKAWIEQTALFHAIVNDVGGTIRLHGPDGEVTGEFARNGRTIKAAEELPIEVLYEFYINSPFYTQEDDNNRNLLNNNK